MKCGRTTERGLNLCSYREIPIHARDFFMMQLFGVHSHSCVQPLSHAPVSKTKKLPHSPSLIGAPGVGVVILICCWHLFVGSRDRLVTVFLQGCVYICNNPPAPGISCLILTAVHSKKPQVWLLMVKIIGESLVCAGQLLEDGVRSSQPDWF